MSRDLLLGRARDSLREGQLAQAFQCFTDAIDRDSHCIEAWHGRGAVLVAQKEFAHAGAQFEQALRIDPGHAPSHFQFAQVLFQFGLIDNALEHLDQVAGKTNGQAELLAAIYAPGAMTVSPPAILARRKLFANSLTTRSTSDIASRPRSTAPCRIAYFSAHFDRPNYMKPVWPLVNEHDRTAFELLFLSDSPGRPEEAGYIRHPNDRWIDTRSIENPELERIIRDQQIDLLVDLNAYSHARRLPLWSNRPAPVNIAWFNMYATSGLPGFDYLVGDRHVFDPQESHLFSERVIALAHSYLTFRVLYETPEIALRTRSRSDGLTLGCLAPMYKVSDAVLAAWSEILRRAPTTRLIIRNGTVDKPSNRQFVQTRLEAAGLPMDRVEFRGRAAHLDFLRTYDDIDLAVDTFPYNGGSTTMEALWQGVPVACFRGDRWAARISASLTAEAGLIEFIADSPQSHVEHVVRLLTDPETPDRLTEYRRNMRSHLRSSSVCDTAGMAREMESLYTRLLPTPRATQLP